MPDIDHLDRTRTAARIIGPYMLVMGLALLARGERLAAMLSGFTTDQPLALVTGAFTLLAGLTLTALHWRWRGPTAVAISLIGIAATLKGASLMIAPDLLVGATQEWTQRPFITAVAMLQLMLGAWLSVAGWRPGLRIRP